MQVILNNHWNTLFKPLKVQNRYFLEGISYWFERKFDHNWLESNFSKCLECIFLKKVFERNKYACTQVLILKAETKITEGRNLVIVNRIKEKKRT